MIGMNFAAVTYCFWQCSCDLCGRNFNGRNWGIDFPEVLGRRTDLDNRLFGGCASAGTTAAYASAKMVGEDYFRDQVKLAGWKLLTVSNDGGVNTRPVAICPDCIEIWYGK